MSMKPGATTQSPASRTRSPSRFGPISLTRPPAMPTSARTPGAPVPSYTVPPLITVSFAIAPLPENMALMSVWDQRRSGFEGGTGCRGGPRSHRRRGDERLRLLAEQPARHPVALVRPHQHRREHDQRAEERDGHVEGDDP